MRIKKGFTLAEILIVLMVIGVIATMTIPSLMKGVAEAQYKAGYKKAYNAIVNLAAMEKVAGQLPSKPDKAQAVLFLQAMANSMSTKEFVTTNSIDSGTVVLPGQAVAGMKVKGKEGSTENTVSIGLTSAAEANTGHEVGTGEAGNSGWLVTDDGLAYSIVMGDGVTAANDCSLKAEILAQQSAADAAKIACLVVIVDVNGLYKGPNRLERQQTSAQTGTGGGSAADFVEGGSLAKMNTLTRDRYYIYLGSDGATSGPVAWTVSGRIIADLK